MSASTDPDILGDCLMCLLGADEKSSDARIGAVHVARFMIMITQFLSKK